MESASRQLLIVDDEPAILKGLEDIFTARGFRVATAVNGEEALEAATSGNFHALLLDLMLPGIHGYEVCRLLRARGDRIPIIMLTALGAEEDKVEGLEIGADDYITKPFSVRELVARVEALLRRAAAPTTPGPDSLILGDLKLDFKRLEGTRSGTAFMLTPREAGILRFLEQNRDRVVRRDELLTEVWGYATGTIETRTVDIHMAKLRKKVEVDPTDPRIILTVRGEGYMLGREGA